MSSSFAISVKNLSKNYHIYERPQDRLKQSFYTRFQRLTGGMQKSYFKDFWALKNISLEIKKGQTVGIVGRNGSGKSTLLQLICGTLNPSDGVIKTNGRIAALLELGSGFNPEFSGRDNVFLNASILGLSQQEIHERFNQIERFADIGDFIDQPVKTYSSGMVVRLAFSVIAHVDADILVVDEALAVGDAIFTQKCMRFIRQFQKRGTLLFVSHDTSAIQNLCNTAIWLAAGEIMMAGSSKEVSEAYLQYSLQEIYGEEVKLDSSTHSDVATMNKRLKGEENLPIVVNYQSNMDAVQNLNSANGWNTGVANILSVTLESSEDGNKKVFAGGESMRLRIIAKCNQKLESPILGFLVRDKLGQDLFGENTFFSDDTKPIPVEAGTSFEGVFEFTLPMLPNGQHALMCSVADGDLVSNIQHHWMHDALIITVSSSKVRYGLVGIPFSRVELNKLND